MLSPPWCREEGEKETARMRIKVEETFIERLAALKVYIYNIQIQIKKKYKKKKSCRRRSVQCIFIITSDKGSISNKAKVQE